MFGKGWASRLDDTIAFVAAHPAPAAIPAADFNLIVAWLRAWRRMTSTGAMEELSGLLSQKGAAQRGDTADIRSYYRATIMIKCVVTLARAAWAGQADMEKRMPGNGVENYHDALNVARNYIRSQPDHVNQMLGELRADPLTLLDSTKFIVNGGNKNGNPTTYKVANVDGAWSFDCYGTNRGRVTLSAINVKATPYPSIQATPGAVTAVDSAVGPGCDLMLTTQFTGCTFCFMKSADGTNLRAAHIDPVRGSGYSGQDVSLAMRTNGGFANANDGPWRAYGRVADNSGLYGYPQSAEQMIIVGIKDGGEWKVYAQVTEQGGNLRAERIDG